MPVIVTDIHDPVALAATCRRLGLDPPREGSVRLDGREASGQVVRLPGLHAPVVCDVLSGLVAYHPRDNDHEPYARIMRFILRFYDVRAALRRGSEGPTPRRLAARKVRRPAGGGEVA